MTVRPAALLLAVLAAASGPVAGQQRPAVDTVDRIVAIVGITPILASQVDEEIFARARGQELPQPGSPEFVAMRQSILQELVDVELLYQQALTDTLVKVSDEQVHSAVDEQMRNVRQQYPTEQEWREDLRNSGFQSPDEYRRWLSEKQRRQLLSNELVDILRATGKIKPVIPTEREMRAYFEQRRTQWRRPETVTFRQIVVAPQPTPEAKARARALADSILAELRRGADFATAARRFSDDVTTRERGGSLGWFRRGVMHTAFENAAFSLRPGVVSDPVETPFGYHLVQVERVQPAEVSARHILLAPELRPEDLDAAAAVAEEVRAALAAGASYDSLARLHHDATEQRELRDYPVDELPPLYTQVLATLEARGVAPVLRLPGPDGSRAKFSVVQLLERHAAGEARYEEVRDRIRADLGHQLAIRRYLDRLRDAVYVEVRGP
jgi:peptidyl-prolyl cis-trans isomerase SurA